MNMIHTALCVLILVLDQFHLWVSNKTCYIPDKTLPVLVDLENVDSDIHSNESFHHAKEEFHAHVKIMDGECIINKGKCVEVFKHGQLVNRVVLSSVRFDMYCPTIAALDGIWSKYTSGNLHKHFEEQFEIQALKEKFKLPNLYLNVQVREEQYYLCKQEIERAQSK